jgi:hypothetical protein
MAEQAIPEFPYRVQDAVAQAQRLAAELNRGDSMTDNVISTPEYQELVRLKVILQVETSRTLSETARVAAELEESDLAMKLAHMEVDQ